MIETRNGSDIMIKEQVVLNRHLEVASRSAALLIFAAALLLAVTAYPLFRQFAISNPNPTVSRGFAVIVTLVICSLATMLGTSAYAAALWRVPTISRQVRWRYYLLSAAVAVTSPAVCFILTGCARHMPLWHLSDDQAVAFLLACSMVVPFVLGLALLQFASRKDWLYPPLHPGLCPHCRYNLTGNTSGICPECGTLIPDGSPKGDCVR